MFKKFAYLASVSVFASGLMTQSVQAMDAPERVSMSTKKPVMFQNHDGVLQVIQEFYHPTSQSLAIVVIPQDNTAEQEVSTASWLFNGAYSVVSSAASTCAAPIGDGSRWLGEIIRGDSMIGDLLVSNALTIAKDTNTVGGTAATLAGTIESKEGAMQSLRSFVGNMARGFGAKLVVETPTLARAIRRFWVDNNYGNKPEDVFTCTACALYLSPDIRGVDHITEAYREVVEAWNRSSRTSPSRDLAHNQEYFLKGITRAYVLAQQPVDEKYTQQILALGFDLKILPATKSITRETILKEKPELAANAVDAQIDVARKAKLLEYAKDLYDYENTKNLANQERQKIITAAVPIESAPAVLRDDLGQNRDLSQPD